LFTSQELPNLYRTWDEYEVTGCFLSEPDNCFVAECEGRVVGFALGSTVEKRRSAWKYGHLYWLGVDEEFQGYGIAGRLFKTFRERMEELGVRILLVDTSANNTAAIEFFRKKGFGDPEDHVYMSLNLETYRREQEKKKNGSG
jgi:ribosomal protein S18 acetylase RimI-like enzyme